MCVIMCKVSGADFPPVEEIKNCCDANPDGFGAMWADGKKVRLFKTMSKEAFLKFYETFAKSYPTSVPLVIHARIATHGSKNINNCHPWLDTNGNTGRVGFCHNGVLSIKNRDDMTDSETFFRDIWLPAFKLGGAKFCDNAVKACIGTSRFCFLYARGNVERWGNWEEGSVKGCFYTNSSWKKNRWEGIGYSKGCGYGNYNYGGGYRGGYRGGYGGYDGYDEDDVYCCGGGVKTPKPQPIIPASVPLITPQDKAASAKVEWLMQQDGIQKASLLFHGEWRDRATTLVRDKTFKDALLKEAMWAPHRCPLWNLFNLGAKDFINGKPKDDKVETVVDIVEKFNREFNLLSVKGILSTATC